MVVSVPAAFPEPFANELRERAFAIWMVEASRSPAVTARILAEQVAAEGAEGGIALPALPNEKTIATWSRRHDWRGKALASLADGNQAKLVLSDTFGKALLAANVTIERVAALTHLPTEDPKNHRTIIEAHKAILESLKTLASFGATLPQMVPPQARRDTDDRPRDRNTVSQEQLARIQKAKHERKGKP